MSKIIILVITLILLIILQFSPRTMTMMCSPNKAKICDSFAAQTTGSFGENKSKLVRF